MDLPASSPSTGENPLRSGSPHAWDRLIEAVGPPGIMVVIQSRMGSDLRARVEPQDVWQEALLHAWRDREAFEWRGIASFRRWLIKLAENRIRDLSDGFGAAKRGSGVTVAAFDRDGDLVDGTYAGPVASTTPSRAAMDRERAEIMNSALGALPEELRDVVRLRLFEELTMEEVASALGITFAAVRHRFRKGVELYHRRLKAQLSVPPFPDPPQQTKPRNPLERGDAQ